MHNLVWNTKRAEDLYMMWKRLWWVVNLTQHAECPNAEWQKGAVQSVMEYILEPLMVFSAGWGGSHAMEGGPDCLKFHTNDIYLNKIRGFHSFSGVLWWYGVDVLLKALQKGEFISVVV